jgi:purine-binding chemotaxis protein CheW
VFASSLAEKQADAPAPLEVLLINLAGELYGLPSASVREVLRYRSHTPVPGAPPTLPGILSQRGVILPLVELRPMLGLPVTEVTRSTRMVIVSHNEVDLALLVEAVLDLAALPADTLGPLPAALDPARARFLRALAQYDQLPVALLDLDEIIASLRAGT